MSLEDNPLVLQYAGKPGGRPAIGQANYARRNLDEVLIAHNVGGDKRFTCNTRVTTDDVFGNHNNGGPVPVLLQLMSELPLPGAKTDIPERALRFLINRFTRTGDTVFSMGGESNLAIEVALGSSRRVEVFLADKASEEGVKERMDVAFAAAYKEGRFKGPDLPTKEVFVGPNRLPQALRADVTPGPVKATRAIAVTPCESHRRLLRRSRSRSRETSNGS